MKFGVLTCAILMALLFSSWGLPQGSERGRAISGFSRNNNNNDNDVTEEEEQNVKPRKYGRRGYRSNCGCQKISNCPKLQISIPRCPPDEFVCCFN